MQQVGVGLIMLLVLLVRPSGLTGGREIDWRGTTRFVRLATSPRRWWPSKTAQDTNT
jgi:hypothetical protein